ncbi:uncharacterized protein VTP21DRAFT_8452 [Calcarisporiella thermophila]|uniref:uncharacterized protein n=1 Tax=Calcarisporiella thermophila TaxID=911321 RepID=UPI0037431174
MNETRFPSTSEFSDKVRIDSNDALETSNTDHIAIAVFFALIFGITFCFIFYYWVTQYRKKSHQERSERFLAQVKEMDQLVENVKWQLSSFTHLPVNDLFFAFWGSHTRKRIMQESSKHRATIQWRWLHLASWTLVLVFLSGIVVLLVGLYGAGIEPKTKAQAVAGGTFLFISAINFFLIVRQRFYYLHRKELLRDDPRVQALSKTAYPSFRPNLWSNWIQIVILVFEFIQLLGFPLRDLLDNEGLQSTPEGDHFQEMVTTILHVAGLIPRLRSSTWYKFELWTTFTGTCVAVLVAAFIHCYNLWRVYSIPVQWAYYFIPVVNLLYIPILNSFVSSAACQSQNLLENKEILQQLPCHAHDIHQPTYLWCSLLGYALAYVLMTVFVTSYEPEPVVGEIEFKTMGVAFLKNMALMLMIDFLLIQHNQMQTRLRGVLSITILLTMVCYNIKVRPCYVDKVNFWRTFSYTCILWTSVFVAMLNDTGGFVLSTGPFIVFGIIAGGWGFVFVVFLTIYLLHPFKGSEEPKGLVARKSTVRRDRKGSPVEIVEYIGKRRIVSPVGARVLNGRPHGRARGGPRVFSGSLEGRLDATLLVLGGIRRRVSPGVVPAGVKLEDENARAATMSSPSSSTTDRELDAASEDESVEQSTRRTESRAEGL